MNNKKRSQRSERRKVKEIELKLKAYISAFMSRCFFDVKKMDWDGDSEEEFLRIDKNWKLYCRKNDCMEYGKEFRANCFWLKTDTISMEKYKTTYPAQMVIGLIRKGKTPLEIVELFNSDLEISKN